MKQLTLLFASMIIFIGCATGGKKSKESSEKHPSIVTEEFVFELDNAPTPQCHASTVAESNGVIVSSWFAGTEEKNKDVGIWVARKVDGKWEAPFEVANGVQEDGTRHPSWNPVLFQPKNGSLMLFYKVGPDPRTWWGLYKTSDDNGLTWSEPHKLPEDILGAIKNQPIQLGNGDILAPSSIEKTGKEWTIHVERSTDGGKTWTTTGSLNNPEKFGAIQPVIYNYGNGKLQMLSRTMNEVITESWSDDYGKTWGEMTATSLPNPNSGIGGCTLSDGRQLLVYNPTGKDWGDRVPLSVAISKDGKNWERVLDLEPLTDKTDREGEEYSYPTAIQASNGMVHIVYTWNRKTVKHVVLNPEKL